jgi:hypothetical protein
MVLGFAEATTEGTGYRTLGIEPIKSAAERGGDELANLWALQWENIASEGGGELVCVIRSQGFTNVRVGKGNAGTNK